VPVNRLTVRWADMFDVTLRAKADRAPDGVFVTTCGVVRNDKLIMGAGAARQMRESFPKALLLSTMHGLGHNELNEAAGLAIAKAGVGKAVGKLSIGGAQTYRYGSVAVAHTRLKGWKQSMVLGCFQTKYHYKYRADPDLIGFSCDRLNELILEWNLKRVYLNYPGIGLGGLPIAMVEKILLRRLFLSRVTLFRQKKPRRSMANPNPVYFKTEEYLNEA